jgi:GDP-4-dehydro-6-deoxy-D-mannose reductase
MPRALVTGGTGFVGKHLVRLLQASGTQVGVLVSYESELRDLAVDSYIADVRNADDVQHAISEFKPSFIYHLAAISSVELSWKYPRLTYEVNVFGTLNVLEAAMRLSSQPRILNVSTAQVYAPNDAALTENSPVRPANPYAISKAMAELAAFQFSRTKAEIIIARGFNHAGAGQSPDFVMSSIAKQFAEIEAGEREPKLELGNIHVKRDFTDVRDVVKAYFLLVKQGQPNEIYNVCSGRSWSIAEIIERFQAISKVKPELAIRREKLRATDIDNMRGDPAKIHAATGWKPEISFKTTVLDLLNYWRGRIREASVSKGRAELSSSVARRG